MAVKRFDLTGRVAVVTGAGANGGIGHAIAVGLAKRGANIVVSDIDDEGARVTGQEVEALGSRPLVLHCDVSSPDDVDSMFDAVDDHFGHVGILVNVPAREPERVRPHELSLRAWDRMLAVTLTGYHLCAQQAIRRMLEQDTGGCILNIGSIAGALALGRANYAYSVAKAGVSQMTRELAVEYAGQGIRVNAILPAQVLTAALRELIDNPDFDSGSLIERFLDGIPLNRLLRPEDFVGPAVFLCSDAAAAVTGALLPVDGGNLALNASGSHIWPTE